MLLTRSKRALSVLSPDAIRLNVSTVLASIPVGFLSIVLPIYFSKVGLDPVLIGQLFTVSSVTSAVLLIVFGLLADRFGRKWFVVLGTLMPAASYVILLTTTDPLLLTLAAGLGGVGLANGISGALASSSFNALLAEKTDDTNRNFLFSLANAGWTGALMIGSLLGGLPEWLQHSLGMGVVDSYRPLFWISLVAVIVGTVILLPIREDHRHVPVAGSSAFRPLTRASLMTAIKLSIFMGLIGLGLGFSVQFLPLWFYLRFGASGDVLGPWYAVTELISTLAVLLVPQLARRLGAVKAVLLTQGASAVGLVAMAIAPATWIAAGLMLVRTTTMNMSWPIQQSYMMGIVHPRERATVSSVTNAAWGLASAISPVASGIWFDQRLLGLPLLAGALCYMASALLLFAYFRHVRPPEETQPAQPATVAANDVAFAADLEDA